MSKVNMREAPFRSQALPKKTYQPSHYYNQPLQAAASVRHFSVDEGRHPHAKSVLFLHHRRGKNNSDIRGSYTYQQNTLISHTYAYKSPPHVSNICRTPSSSGNIPSQNMAAAFGGTNTLLFPKLLEW